MIIVKTWRRYQWTNRERGIIIWLLDIRLGIQGRVMLIDIVKDAAGTNRFLLGRCSWLDVRILNAWGR